MSGFIATFAQLWSVKTKSQTNVLRSGSAGWFPWKRSGRVLTFLVQEELVEPQAAGLLANEAVDVVGAVVVHGDGVFQRLHARLQAEGDLRVAHRVPEKKKKRKPFSRLWVCGLLQLIQRGNKKALKSRRGLPLSIHGAQSDGPQIGTEAGQLGNVVRHLQRKTSSFCEVKETIKTGDFFWGDVPDRRAFSWRSRRVRRCGRRKAGSPGWQTSSWRPEWAERCCSERTWVTTRSCRVCVQAHQNH